jgi:Protein of unknown function (DUF3134)
VTIYNPSLREEPKNQKASIIPPRELESLFKWIEGTGRFLAYELGDGNESAVEAEELEAIMGTSAIYDLEEEEEDLDLED